MFSYKVLSFVSWIMVFSLGYLVAEILAPKYGNGKDVKFLKYAKIVLFILSFCMFVWILLSKELFHWNFDIATGEPVDHYSTYTRCMVRVIIALESNVISYIIAKKRKVE